jgi:quercetin 2,3-dioxygenase
MITQRSAADRGHADHGWLLSHHSFSFADYHDPRFMGFRTLRVLNEDIVAPGEGFPTHSHHDMEILTWILEGALEHKDSMGNGSVIRPGELQRMSAGTGVQHSEANPSQARVHLLQIWIVPEQRGLPPGYEQKAFPEAARRGKLCLLASRNGRDGSVTIHQDAELWTALLARGEQVVHPLRPGRHAWVQVARGTVTVRGNTTDFLGASSSIVLRAGDGASISEEQQVVLLANEGGPGGTPAEVLLFDLG